MYGVCVSFVVFTDCESCTRPISTNPGIYESGRVWANAWDVFRRTPPRGGRGRRSCCGFRGVFWVRRDFVFFRFFFFERARPAASMRPPCLIYLSASSKGIFVFWVFVLQLLYVSKGKWQLISIYLVPISSVCPAYKISSPKKTIT